MHYRTGDPLKGGPLSGDKNAIAFLSAARAKRGAGLGLWWLALGMELEKGHKQIHFSGEWHWECEGGWHWECEGEWCPEGGWHWECDVGAAKIVVPVLVEWILLGPERKIFRIMWS